MVVARHDGCGGAAPLRPGRLPGEGRRRASCRSGDLARGHASCWRRPCPHDAMRRW